MRSHKLISFIIIFSWLFSIATFAYSASQSSDPVSMLQNVANNMVNQLRANKATLKTKPQIVYQLAYRYVVPYADIPEMSKRVLPPSVWNKASSSERARFQKEFTSLLIRTYASALTAYKDQEVRFYPVRGGYANATTVEVSSDIVSSESSPIHVTYRLLHTSGGWRLFDMSVEGVSLIQSFRSQFADILSNGSMEQLLQRMSSHNAG